MSNAHCHQQLDGRGVHLWRLCQRRVSVHDRDKEALPHGVALPVHPRLLAFGLDPRAPRPNNSLELGGVLWISQLFGRLTDDGTTDGALVK